MQVHSGCADAQICLGWALHWGGDETLKWGLIYTAWLHTHTHTEEPMDGQTDVEVEIPSYLDDSSKLLMARKFTIQ